MTYVNSKVLHYFKFQIYVALFYDEQLSSAAVTSFCAICNDESTSGVDDHITAGRKSVAEYACVDCGGDRMCADCACAHRKQRLSRGHELVELNGDAVAKATASSMTSLVCVNHPPQPVIAYCGDCETALCDRCLCVGGPSTGTCAHSSSRELSTVAQSGRAHLEEDEQVDV